MLTLPSITGHIPFVAQRTIDGASRTCGAAVLAMVYQSQGLAVSQLNLFRRIATGEGESRYIKTFRMAGDAIDCGFECLVARAESDPLFALRTLLQNGWGIIINIQLAVDLPWGHYAVVVAMHERQVHIHDPLQGPNIVISDSQIMERWRAPSMDAEISGFVLVAVRKPIRSVNHLAPREEMICPQCQASFPLFQDIGLGAATDWHPCWDCLFCPRCDMPIGPPKKNYEYQYFDSKNCTDLGKASL